MQRVRVGAVALFAALLAVVAAPAGAAPAPKPVAPRGSAGCHLANAPAAGETEVPFSANGVARSYLRHVPPGANPAQPLPLVVDFPGYLETDGIEARTSQLGTYGDTHGFVTVTPQALGPVYHWNAIPGSADVRLVGTLLDDVERSVCIDTRRVYVTGLSNGGMMTSAVICAYSDRIAAAAPVAGITLIPGCKPKRAVPVITFHGTADPFLSYAGGLGPAALALPAPDGSAHTLQDSGSAATFQGPPVPKIVATYAHRNGCRAQPATQTVASDVTEFRYRCPPGAEVELYRVTGGGHSWPGSAFSAATAKLVGPTTFSISATELIWRFFTQYPRSAR